MSYSEIGNRHVAEIKAFMKKRSQLLQEEIKEEVVGKFVHTMSQDFLVGSKCVRFSPVFFITDVRASIELGMDYTDWEGQPEFEYDVSYKFELDMKRTLQAMADLPWVNALKTEKGRAKRWEKVLDCFNAWISRYNAEIKERGSLGPDNDPRWRDASWCRFV